MFKNIWLFLIIFFTTYDKKLESSEMIYQIIDLNKTIYLDHSYNEVSQWWKDDYEKVFNNIGLKCCKEKNDLLDCNVAGWKFKLINTLEEKDDKTVHNIRLYSTESGELIDQNALIEIYKNDEGKTNFKIKLYAKINKITTTRILNAFVEVFYLKFKKQVNNKFSS